MRVEAAQAAFKGIVAELRAIEERLQAIGAALPLPANHDAMLEGRAPYDLATELVATIEVVVADDIQSAIDRLERGSRITVEDLRQAFERR